MPFSNRLAMLANVREGEGPLVAWVLLFAGLSITTQLLGNTVAYALFLSTFDAQRLPYIYIGSSIVTTLLSLLYLRLSQRYSLAQLLIGQCGFILLTVVGYRIGLVFTAGPWFIFSLPIWDGVVSALVFAAFWSLVGRLFNLQQGKRLFGLFGAGQQIATLLVGALVPLLVGWIGTINLLLLAALAGVGTLAALLHITRTFPVLQHAAQEEPEASADTTASLPVSSKNLLADPYIRLIFAMYILYALGSYFVDNIFYTQVESQWTNQDQLAGFLGIFNGVVGGLSLLSQLFLAPRLLSRYGVRTVILLTPAIVLGFITFFVLIGISSQLVLLLFWMAVSTNLFLQIADSSDNTAANLLYQPLPSALRTQTQTTVDGIIAPVATGLTGLILLWLTNFLHFNAVQLGYVLWPILIVWLLIAIALGRNYPKRVQQALRQRIVQGNSRFQPDRASLEVIQQNLNNPHPGAVIYALDVLEALSPAELGRTLPALLQHPAPAVRLDVLARLERLGDGAALPTVSRTFQTTLDPQTRSAALRTWATLGGSEQFDDLFPYLNAVDPELRQGVMVGLLRSGELEGILAVGETLAQLVNSADIADRTFAARVLGESGMASFYRPLVKLLRDPEPTVQRAALLATSKLQQPKLWPIALEGLASRQTRSAAQNALIAGGEQTLPELKIALERPTLELDVRLALVRICGRIRSAQAVPFLLTQLAHPHVQVRTQTLLALQQCGYTADIATRPLIEQQLAAEFAQAAWLLAGIVALEEAATAPLLSAALMHSLAQQRDRFFLWLALLYDNATVLRVRNAFRSMQSAYREGSDEQRAYALETMEVLFPKNMTKNLLPLLEEIPFSQQLQRLAGDFPQPALSVPERLLTILTETAGWLNPWVKAVALYTAVQSPFLETGKTTLCPVANNMLADPEPLLQETATWALNVLAQPDEQRANGATTMLLTIEKVMILKTVDIFAQTPDEILADIAALLKEVEAPPGATIFEKGEQGDSMYIIVEGEVEALDGERAFTRMGERQVFGEMALLDGEPRTASIRTTQATRLLRLDQEPFYELMDDRIEIARGVIHVLLQRLRARTDDLNQLRRQLADTGSAKR